MMDILEEYQHMRELFTGLEHDYFLRQDLIDQIFGNPRMNETERQKRGIYDNDLNIEDINRAIENLTKLREELTR